MNSWATEWHKMASILQMLLCIADAAVYSTAIFLIASHQHLFFSLCYSVLGTFVEIVNQGMAISIDCRVGFCDDGNVWTLKHGLKSFHTDH